MYSIKYINPIPGIPSNADTPTVRAFIPKHKSNLNKIQFSISIKDDPITPCIHNLLNLSAIFIVNKHITNNEIAYITQLNNCADIT